MLQPFLPEGCEFDLYNGTPHLSVVAFQFHHTKVFGIKWPGLTHFPEVNLRFYVRHKGERGVCFIREFVPSQIISGVAQLLYNEPYKTAIMTDVVESSDTEITAAYSVRDEDQTIYMYAKADKKPYVPGNDTLEHHFKEHELGVGQSRSGKTQTYRVHHPVWHVYPVVDYKIELHAEIYGEDFSFLSTQKPDSVVFAEGSQIKVYHKQKQS